MSCISITSASRPRNCAAVGRRLAAVAPERLWTRSPAGAPPPGTHARVTSWLYQLQGYPGGRLDAIARAPQQLAVIDLARDANTGYFRPDEIAALHRAGKTVLAYFEIGSVEDFRPEYAPLRRDAGDLVLNKWPDWPNEYFVRYWDERWWSDDRADSVYSLSYLAEYRGIIKWLIHNHVPFDIVVRPDDAELSRYVTVIAPALTAVSDREAELLDGYVAGGGKLVVTGPKPASLDELGDPRRTAALKSLGRRR